MKFSLGFVAITSLAASVFAAPSAVKRDACSSTVDETTYPSALSIVQSLKSSVDTYNASITSAHEAYVSSGDLATATTAYEGIVSSITDAFSSASSDVTALTGVDISSVETEFADCIASITKRQATDLETALEEILEELTASLSTIVDDLGLSTSPHSLIPFFCLNDY